MIPVPFIHCLQTFYTGWQYIKFLHSPQLQASPTPFSAAQIPAFQNAPKVQSQDKVQVYPIAFPTQYPYASIIPEWQNRAEIALAPLYIFLVHEVMVLKSIHCWVIKFQVFGTGQAFLYQVILN